MTHINPTIQQFKKLDRIPDSGPVVMVNLLKFKPEDEAEKNNEYSRRAVHIFERNS